MLRKLLPLLLLLCLAISPATATWSPPTDTVLDPPTANFAANVTAGNAPLAVNFTDTSTGNVTAWSWEFGDGTNSTAQHPVHTYDTAGTYTVSLTATSAYGSDTETKTNLIRVTALRPKTTRTIAPLDEGPYNHFFASFGGSQQLNETTEGVDWLGLKDAAEEPYTAALGSLFFALLFALPFVMQWLRQGSMAIPCVLGIILGSIMLAKAPAEYHIVAVVFVALGVLAVVWGVIKDRV